MTSTPEAATPTEAVLQLTGIRAAYGRIEVLHGMRIVPVSSRTLISLAIVALLPLAPLVLFKVPLADLAAQIIGRLTGG